MPTRAMSNNMKILNIAVKKTYQKDGAEKTTWLNVGSLIKFEATSEKPEQLMIELNMFPTQRFYVFEPKAVAPAPKPVEKIPDTRVAPDQQDINPDDIPF